MRLRKSLVCLINKENWDRNQTRHARTHTNTHAHQQKRQQQQQQHESNLYRSIWYVRVYVVFVLKQTVSFDGFIEKIKAPSQYAADSKVTDAIIYLCKMRGTFIVTRQAYTQKHTRTTSYCHSVYMLYSALPNEQNDLKMKWIIQRRGSALCADKRGQFFFCFTYCYYDRRARIASYWLWQQNNAAALCS